MPVFLLHNPATVLCLHGGQAHAAVTSGRVRINGQPIVLQSSPYTITGCPFRVGFAASPCLSAQWISGATRIRSEGQPVLLSDSSAICTPNGTGLRIAATQTRVTGL